MLKKRKPKVMVERWYIENRSPSGTYTMRGPYKHHETAGAVRQEMEQWADDEQLKRWDLCIVCRKEEVNAEEA